MEASIHLLAGTPGRQLFTLGRQKLSTGKTIQGFTGPGAGFSQKLLNGSFAYAGLKFSGVSFKNFWSFAA